MSCYRCNIMHLMICNESLCQQRSNVQSHKSWVIGHWVKFKILKQVCGRSRGLCGHRPPPARLHGHRGHRQGEERHPRNWLQPISKSQIYTSAMNNSNIDPFGRPTVMAGSDNCFHKCRLFKFAQNKIIFKWK